MGWATSSTRMPPDQVRVRCKPATASAHNALDPVTNPRVVVSVKNSRVSRFHADTAAQKILPGTPSRKNLPQIDGAPMRRFVTCLIAGTMFLGAPVLAFAQEAVTV